MDNCIQLSLAVAGMTIPLVAGVAGFIKDELRRPTAVKRTR